MILGLNQRVDDLSKNLGENLQQVTATVLNQLNENTKQVDMRLQTTNQHWLKSTQEIRRVIDSNVQSISSVNSKLAQMDESNKRIFEVGKDISSLQEILRAPKLRGALGELFLGDLLSQVFNKDRYHMQYAFRSGEIADAVLVMPDQHLISIDAKFPLESFKRMLDTQDENQRKDARKQFSISVKRRIDEIASKYILPEEKTLDFALMYIPAENVYYEIIVRGGVDFDIMPYGHTKRVIPVSPNTLYVYLQTIALGLRGMQIEERAKDILSNLSKLNNEFTKVTDSYEVLGKHLSNAVGKYDEAGKHLSKFGNKMEQIEEKNEAEQIALIEPIAPSAQ
jgi:DNA recombination protein RmuC